MPESGIQKACLVGLIYAGGGGGSHAYHPDDEGPGVGPWGPRHW